MHRLKVSIVNRQKRYSVDEEMRATVRSCLAQVLSDEGFDLDAFVTVTFVDDRHIHELNREHRGVDRPTDVLSFPLGENGEYDLDPETGLYQLGDVVISMDTAHRQAEEYGHSLQRETAFLCVHSMLHLLGYDHMEPDEEKVMCEKQELALGRLGITRESEQEKMLGGKLYDPTDPKLAKMRQEARTLAAKINSSDPSDARTAKLIRKLIPGLGKDSFVEPPVRVDYGCFITIGERCYINFNLTALDCARIDIGDDVFIGPNVSIVTPLHPMNADERILRRRSDGSLYDLEFAKPVAIGDKCWIAADVTICPGVVIGEGTVIGAGSVVISDIPAGVFAAGNPCRVIRMIEETE